ncbi:MULTISPECIES: hypothetical protein [Chryseobacterium]|uniref:hypothetical protein n=1 Tax=Chryseobacterium TaxID=59732 RepID=UPI00195C078A|nr:MULTISPECIES: hypothetical protein [Chryseobacterium]MBM7420922.1 hypothetical protein [Chryseobacterium sp. JUb44]MDH6210879.1 hypothetical protein [Chryseobacterium sp. BIGb0186]WSO09549.1 hypothetical protein VUJ64_17155 [Chryseobacterium scophthalmum]
MFKISLEIKYNIKLFTIISNVLFVSALLLPKIVPESYRFGDLHDVWAFSVMTVFVFHGIAIFLTILNIAFIIPKINESRNKYYILILCNAPVIAFWGWLAITILFFT